MPHHPPTNGLALYNEIDPYAAQWLRNLIAAGHIAAGIVHEGDICDLTPEYCAQFTQCHFFAGVGVWSLALRRAGWRDEWPIWTGSCPCQPFSNAGKGGGQDDERHLWPAFFHLIDECGPPVVLGEQVASKDGLDWLDLVCADLESAGYAFGSDDLSAAGFGGAHIRQRLYFVGLGDTELPKEERFRAIGGQGLSFEEAARSSGGGMAYGLDLPRPDTGLLRGRGAGGLANGHDAGSQGRGSAERGKFPALRQDAPCGPARGLADSDGGLPSEEREQSIRLDRLQPNDCGARGLADNKGIGRGQECSDAGRLSLRDSAQGRSAGLGASGGHSDADEDLRGWPLTDWLRCRDGKWRPVESGTFPLANEVASRMGRLRAYGNGLDAATAEAFIRAVMGSILALYEEDHQPAAPKGQPSLF